LIWQIDSSTEHYSLLNPGELAMPKSSNQRFSHEIETRAKAADISALWMDVANWNSWDLGLTSSKIDEPMALGATGWLTDNNGRRSRFSVIELHAPQSYTFATKLPFGSLVVRRSILQDKPCRFRHDVHFEGIGGFLLSHVLAPSFRKQLPPTMAKLSELAELNMKNPKELP
jgi:hypothetical protein